MNVIIMYVEIWYVNSILYICNIYKDYVITFHVERIHEAKQSENTYIHTTIQAYHITSKYCIT